ncbi:MAG: transposase [Agitococcus sp.]|nr:transposase [Agitococcus sp.]
MRKKYPSDTTDYQWRLVRSIFNKQKGSVGRPPEAPAREMLDAILYLMRHGGTWRSLPGDFPPWQSVYTQRTRWSEDGTLERAMKQLEPKRHRRGSRSKRYAPTLGIIDVTFTESAYGGEGSAPSGYKRATGFFVHTLIDKAYRGAGLVAEMADIGVELNGDSPPLPDGTIFVPMPVRWRIERFFSWFAKWRRIAKNWCYTHLGFAWDVRWSMFGLTLKRYKDFENPI